MHSETDSNASVDSSRSKQITVFGEVLWDCFPDGSSVLGGAPFNVAWTLKGLGYDPMMLSAVGSDEEGTRILERMQRWNLRTDGIQVDAGFPTGRVEVTLEQGQPSYEIVHPVAWDRIEPPEDHAADVIYHGSLALRSEANRDALQLLFSERRVLRFFDVNLRPPYTPLERVIPWLEGADWVKLNLEEMQLISGNPNLQLANSARAIAEFRMRYGIGNVILTAAAQGAVLEGDYGYSSAMPAPELPGFKDTVGAGDAFTSVVLHSVLAGVEAEAIVPMAGYFAAKVCTLNGATTDNKAFYTMEDYV